MQIEKKEIAHVARLSMLSPREDELCEIQKDLTEILQMVDTLMQWDEGAETAPARRLQNVTREDIVQPSFDREMLLRNAAVRNEQGIIVPKTVE